MSIVVPTRAHGRDRFVGRTAELAALASDLAHAPRPEGPVRLLRGPAGIGKTRLAAELAHRAATSGVAVAWAHRLDDLTAPPYWPWTQVVRTLLGRSRGTDLAELVLDGAPSVDPFELFDATAAVVREATEQRPVLVVLDDLHAADEATMALTRFVARHLADAPFLLVATIRPGAGVHGGPVGVDHLDELARLGRVHDLPGLPVAAVAELVGHHDHAAAVHAVTGGNPRSLHQLLPTLPRRGGAVPATTVGRRVDAPDALARTVPRARSVERPPAPAVRVIGGFEVTDLAGRPARWTSRKARELLKILVSRRGAPVDREVLMGLLWPGDDPAVLTNRLSVALSTVRRALDAERSLPAGDLVSTAFDAVALNLAVVDVDVEHLLEGARRVLAQHRAEGPGATATAALATAAAELLDRHRGEALPDEPHAEWAVAIRHEVATATRSLARLVAEHAERSGDHLRAVEAHQRILGLDPYDVAAHVGLVAAYREMGAHGQARAAHDAYLHRMAELGVPAGPVPGHRDE